MPDVNLDEETISNIKSKMQEIIDADLEITKKALSVDEAMEYYKLSNDTDKIALAPRLDLLSVPSNSIIVLSINS